MRGQPQPGVPPFHCDDGFDEFLVRSLGAAGSTPTRTRKQRPVLWFLQQLVQVQQGGRPQADGGTQDACRAHEHGAQTGDDAIRGTQVGRTLAAATKDEQLMSDQHRFGNDGTESAWPRQPRQGDDQMNE